ncbi:hypothetical protein K439DRAFT_1634770 [Ramaria rubella]|nr:hypothetical protein K439DRAFT_1634770 [Ramaria rubella]
MPASSPMSGFAAHGLAPQARRNGLRRRRSTVGYLATGGTPGIIRLVAFGLVEPPFDIQASERSLRRPCDTDGTPVQSASSRYLPQRHLLRLD